MTKHQMSRPRKEAKSNGIRGQRGQSAYVPHDSGFVEAHPTVDISRHLLTLAFLGLISSGSEV